MERSTAVPAKRGRAKRLCRVAGLFAGIGGIEQGLHQAGHRTELLCELDDSARTVLAHHFPRVLLASDIRDLHLPPARRSRHGGVPLPGSQSGGQDGRHRRDAIRPRRGGVPARRAGGHPLALA